MTFRQITKRFMRGRIFYFKEKKRAFISVSDQSIGLKTEIVVLQDSGVDVKSKSIGLELGSSMWGKNVVSGDMFVGCHCSLQIFLQLFHGNQFLWIQIDLCN